jgi:serine/threonine protein kinase
LEDKGIVKPQIPHPKSRTETASQVSKSKRSETPTRTGKSVMTATTAGTTATYLALMEEKESDEKVSEIHANIAPSERRIGENIFPDPPKFGKRADMFSFGCVMFDVASMGIQRAFTEDHEIRRYRDDYPNFAVRELKRLWDTELDNLTLKSFNRWIRECLDLDPDRRPEAVELKKRLEMKLIEAYGD